MGRALARLLWIGRVLFTIAIFMVPIGLIAAYDEVAIQFIPPEHVAAARFATRSVQDLYSDTIRTILHVYGYLFGDNDYQFPLHTRINSFIDLTQRCWHIVLIGSRVYTKVFELLEQALRWCLPPPWARVLVTLINLKIIYGLWRDLAAVGRFIGFLVGLPLMVLNLIIG